MSCESNFTSTAPKFDFEQAVNVDSSHHEQTHAANFRVQITAPRDCIAATFKKTHWSARLSWLEGGPELVLLLLLRVRLFWILRFTGYDGGFANAKAAYDSSFLLTSFSEPRRLRWDEVGANGTVSGTR